MASSPHHSNHEAKYPLQPKYPGFDLLPPSKIGTHVGPGKDLLIRRHPSSYKPPLPPPQSCHHKFDHQMKLPIPPIVAIKPNQPYDPITHSYKKRL